MLHLQHVQHTLHFYRFWKITPPLFDPCGSMICKEATRSHSSHSTRSHSSHSTRSHSKGLRGYGVAICKDLQGHGVIASNETDTNNSNGKDKASSNPQGGELLLMDGSQHAYLIVPQPHHMVYLLA
jgi:hypothetical protein